MLKRKFKVSYLLFLIIPVVYYFLSQGSSEVNKPDQPDYFYFTAQSSKPATISLFSGKTQLASWELNSEGDKYLDFSGKVDASNGLTLSVSNLNYARDINFLSFNLVQNGQLYSLNDGGSFQVDKSNKEGTPFIVTLKPLSNWDTTHAGNHFKYYLALLFLFVFIVIILLSPPVRYFIITCFITVAVMLITSWFAPNETGKLEMKTNSPLKRTEFYFNQSPQFTHLKRASTDNAGKYFSAEIDLRRNRFIRFDVDNTNEIKDLDLGVKCGIFSKTWDIWRIPIGNLVMNDLKAEDGRFRVCGPDPFIALTSNYFIDDITWLLLLQKSVFLFISLLSFIVLLSLHYWIGRYFYFQFKCAYLFFFIIPAIYFFFFQNNFKANVNKQKDYFYYSVKTSKPALISLFAGKDSVTSWNVNSAGYRMLDCVCNLNDSAGLILKVKSLAMNDTASFLAFDFFRNNSLFSLYDRSYPYCAVENASTTNKDGVFSVIANNADAPIKVHLIKTSEWQEMQHERRPGNIVIFVFILAFVVVLVMSPPSRYFILSCIITLFVLALFNWLGQDIQDQVTMSTSSAQRSVESYFSNTPVFHKDDKFPTKDFRYFFRTQVELGKHQYLRCDPDDSIKQLKNFKVSVRAGLLNKEWDFTKIPIGNAVLNDMNYNNGNFTICGSDPFFALTTTFFVDPIHRLMEIRYNVFLFLSLFIFVFLIFIHKPASHLNNRSFFLFAFFLTIIFNGLLFKPFNSDRVRLKSEKRDVDSIPQFNIDSVKNFTRQLNNFLNDQVNGRNKIIPLNNYIYYSIFGQLLNNPNVYFGKDGWMFYVGANGRETYENRKPVSLSDLIKIKALIEERRDWLKQRGIKLYIIFPVMTQFIYEEELGSLMFRHHKITKLQQLLTYLKANSDLDIIDVEKPLIEAKKFTKPDLCYRTSTHWTYYGAYFAYAAIINHIQKDFPEIGNPIPFKEIQWKLADSITKDVDLIEMCALSDYLKGSELRPLHPDVYAGDTVQHYFQKGEPDFPYLYVVNKKKTHPNMLMFRDSYTRHLYPYLAHHFNQSTYLWTTTFNKELVEDAKPDMVIWEMSDRFIPFYFIYKNAPFAKGDSTVH